MSRIAVIGGGITGLAAAHRLTELDPHTKPWLFESGPRPGSVLATESVDGFRIEAGPDSMLAQLPWGMELCRRIGIADELIGTSSHTGQTWIVRSGRLLPLPDGLAIMAPRRLWPTVCSPILSIAGKLRLACEPFMPRRKQAGDESLAEFASRRVGRETFERLVQPLVSGIYMADPQRLSIQAALPRFAAMESEHGSLIRAARRSAAAERKKQSSARTSSAPASMFVAPRAGMGGLISALASRLPAGSIRLNSTVQELIRTPEGDWRVRGLAGPKPFDERFEAVILATPSNRTAELLKGIDRPLASELSEISYSRRDVCACGGRHKAGQAARYSRRRCCSASSRSPNRRYNTANCP